MLFRAILLLNVVVTTARHCVLAGDLLCKRTTAAPSASDNSSIWILILCQLTQRINFPSKSYFAWPKDCAMLLSNWQASPQETANTTASNCEVLIFVFELK